MSEKPEMKRSKSALAKARLQQAVAAQEKRLTESWYGKMIPNDYEEYRKLVDPSPEELDNAHKLDVLGRTVTVTYVFCGNDWFLLEIVFLLTIKMSLLQEICLHLDGHALPCRVLQRV